MESCGTVFTEIYLLKKSIWKRFIKKYNLRFSCAWGSEFKKSYCVLSWVETGTPFENPALTSSKRGKQTTTSKIPYAQFKSRCPHSTANKNKIKMFSNHCMERLYDKSNKPSITMLATARRRKEHSFASMPTVWSKWRKRSCSWEEWKYSTVIQGW